LDYIEGVKKDTSIGGNKYEEGVTRILIQVLQTIAESLENG